jgi:HEAT repeat protein
VSIVRSIIAGRRTFTEAEQARLLEISRDAWAIGELAGDCTSAFCSTDGSPLLTTQAATVLAVYRHLAATVRVLDEERTGEVMGNLAVATASLDPGLAVEVLRLEEETGDSPLARDPEPLAHALRRALDEQQVAMLLARAMARTGSATSRLALMLETLAPDEERRQRVLRLTRQLLSERDFGATRPLEDLQSSLEELMLKYDESPFVSAAYRQSLDVAAERAIDLAARDLPPERDEWLQTLGHESVRELSAQLLIDLLTLETVPEQAAAIASDMSAFAQELIVAGAYHEAQRVAGALHAATVRTNAIAAPAVREALHAIGRSAAMTELASVLGELPAAEAQAAADLCTTVGPSCVSALVTALGGDSETAAVERARAILVALGEPAIPALADRLVHLAAREWIVHRRLADVLGRIGTPAAVAPLQTLLRHFDPRVLPEVVGALAAIDHPSAARALHTALRAATGPAREAIVQALVARRDRRVVPLLARLLDQSAALGQDFEMALQTIDAIASFQDDRALPPLAALARRRSWLAPRRTRRLRERTVAALQRIGTANARDLLERLRATGDRQLRRIVGAQTRRATA